MGDFLKQNWGNLASVVGLGVSLCVLFVAQRAKEAAEGARSADAEEAPPPDWGAWSGGTATTTFGCALRSPDPPGSAEG